MKRIRLLPHITLGEWVEARRVLVSAAQGAVRRNITMVLILYLLRGIGLGHGWGRLLEADPCHCKVCFRGRGRVEGSRGQNRSDGRREGNRTKAFVGGPPTQGSHRDDEFLLLVPLLHHEGGRWRWRLGGRHLGLQNELNRSLCGAKPGQRRVKGCRECGPIQMPRVLDPRLLFA